MLSRYLVHMRNAAQRWFKFYNVGPSPYKRSHHTMASYETRVFVLGGHSEGAGSDEISLIQVFDTSMCFRSVVSSGQPSKLRTQNTSNTRIPSVTPPFPMRGLRNLREGHPQFPRPKRNHNTRGPPHQRPSLLLVCKRYRCIGSLCLPADYSRAKRRSEWPAMGTPDVNSKPRRDPEDDVSEGSTGYYAKFAAPHSFEEVTRLELERRLSLSLAAQTGRDQCITQLTDELALKSALLERAEANAVEAARRAGPEVREHADDRRLMRLSLVKQRDVELVDMQARLRDMQARLDELLLSRYQQTRKHEKELANMRAKLEAKESELEAVRSQLMDAEKGWIKSKAEADILRAQTATGSVNRHEDQATRRLMERVQAIEAEMTSRRWNEKSVESMDRNER